VGAIFAQAAKSPLVAVTAGPGYGKTCAVREFLRGSPSARAVWVSCGRHNSSAADFWRAAVGAAKSVFPGAAAELEAMGFPSGAGKFGALARLIQRAPGAESPVYYVADGYEYGASAAVDRLLGQMAAIMPTRSSLIVTSRRGVGPAILEQAGGMGEIAAEDLAFTTDETQLLFELHGRRISPGRAAEIRDFAEGWALALRLLLRDGDRGAAIGGRGAGANLAQLSGLFESECYAAYGADVRLMLSRLSLLPEFTLEIASRALLAGGGGGVESEGGAEGARIAGSEGSASNAGGTSCARGEKSDAGAESAEAAAEAIRGNPFIGYDRRSGLYAFHGMYRAFLAERLPMPGIGERKRLWRDAGGAFIEAGHFARAADCCARGGAYGMALEAMYRHIGASAGLTRETAARFEAMLESLPSAYRDESPLVAYVWAQIDMNRLDAGSALGRLAAAEARLGAIPPGERSEFCSALLGDVYYTMGLVRIMQNEPSFTECFKKASTLLPNGSPLRAPRKLCVGSNSVLALGDSAPGALRRMEEAVREAAPHFTRVAKGGGSGYGRLFSAEAAYSTLDFAAARQNSYRAIFEAEEARQHDIACGARIILAKAALMAGDADEFFGQVDSVQRRADSPRGAFREGGGAMPGGFGGLRPAARRKPAPEFESEFEPEFALEFAAEAGAPGGVSERGAMSGSPEAAPKPGALRRSSTPEFKPGLKPKFEPESAAEAGAPEAGAPEAGAPKVAPEPGALRRSPAQEFESEFKSEFALEIAPEAGALEIAPEAGAPEFAPEPGWREPELAPSRLQPPGTPELAPNVAGLWPARDLERDLAQERAREREHGSVRDSAQELDRNFARDRKRDPARQRASAHVPQGAPDPAPQGALAHAPQGSPDPAPAPWSPGIDDLREFALNWMYLKMGDLKALTPWIAERGSPAGGGPPILRGRDRLLYACCLNRAGRHDELLAMLDGLESFCERRGLWIGRLDVHIIRAVAFSRLRDEGRAMRSLRLAYDMSHGNGIIAPFVEAGSYMRALMDSARRRGCDGLDEGWVDSVHRKSCVYAKKLSAVSREYFRRKELSQASLPGGARLGGSRAAAARAGGSSASGSAGAAGFGAAAGMGFGVGNGTGFGVGNGMGNGAVFGVGKGMGAAPGSGPGIGFGGAAGFGAVPGAGFGYGGAAGFGDVAGFGGASDFGGAAGFGAAARASQRGCAGSPLSKRETSILRHLSQGLTRRDIADADGISVNTAKSVITNVYNKLGAVNKADAVRIAASMGLIG
jgi:ATP/maltotriose-dependent transcriptional regulator MalT